MGPESLTLPDVTAIILAACYVSLIFIISAIKNEDMYATKNAMIFIFIDMTLTMSACSWLFFMVSQSYDEMHFPFYCALFLFGYRVLFSKEKEIEVINKIFFFVTLILVKYITIDTLIQSTAIDKRISSAFFYWITAALLFRYSEEKDIDTSKPLDTFIWITVYVILALISFKDSGITVPIYAVNSFGFTIGLNVWSMFFYLFFAIQTE